MNIFKIRSQMWLLTWVLSLKIGVFMCLVHQALGSIPVSIGNSKRVWVWIYHVAQAGLKLSVDLTASAFWMWGTDIHCHAWLKLFILSNLLHFSRDYLTLVLISKLVLWKRYSLETPCWWSQICFVVSLVCSIGVKRRPSVSRLHVQFTIKCPFL